MYVCNIAVKCGDGERREVVPDPFTVPFWRALDDVQYRHPQVAVEVVVVVVVGMPGEGTRPDLARIWLWRSTVRYGRQGLPWTQGHRQT